jgi:hypothetical protein
MNRKQIVDKLIPVLIHILRNNTCAHVTVKVGDVVTALKILDTFHPFKDFNDIIKRGLQAIIMATQHEKKCVTPQSLVLHNYLRDELSKQASHVRVSYKASYFLEQALKWELYIFFLPR